MHPVRDPREQSPHLTKTEKRKPHISLLSTFHWQKQVTGQSLLLEGEWKSAILPYAWNVGDQKIHEHPIQVGRKTAKQLAVV